MRLFLENFDDLAFIYRLKPSRCYDYVNRASTNITGYTPEEYYANPKLGMKIIHPDDASVLEKILRGEIFDKTVTLRWIKKDGKIIHMEHKNIPVYDGSGELVAVQGIGRDVTMRKAADAVLIGREDTEYKISKSEAEHRALIEQLPQGTWVYKAALDDITSTIYVSPQIETLGFTQEEWISNRNLWSRQLHPDDRDRVLMTFRKIDEHDKPFICEYRLYASDGSLRWFRDHSLVVRDGTGKPLFYQGVLTDISDLKRAEEALKNSEALYHEIFEQITDYILVLEPVESGPPMIINASRSAFEKHGYSREEMIGKPITFLDPEEGKVPMRKEEIFRQGFGRFEVMHKRKDGSTFLAEVHVKVITIAGRALLYTVERDITDRKRVEAALQESEERFRLLSETGFDGIFIHINHTVVEINQEMADILGKDRKSLIGEKSIEWFTPESRTKVIDYMLTGSGIVYEIDLMRADGKIVHAEAFGQDCNFQGQKARIVAIRDITESTLARVALQKSKEDAEKATVLKDKFVSLVSHDLRSPIAVILGYLQLMRDDLLDDRSQKEFINECIESCNDMNLLIKDILNVRRISGNGILPEQAFFLVYEMAGRVKTKFSTMAARKGVNIINDIPENMLVYADERLLLEVMKNLVSNALKFCRNGDSVRLFIPDGELSTIAVSDTGTGIEESRIGTLFNYETRTSTLGTSGEMGSGLGLPLSLDIMTAHGGNLELSSTPGKGSTFYIKLPDAKQAQGD